MIALKEWSIICNALEKGDQIILLRKGGIMEYRQGFEIKHEKFFLFPTFEHQAEDAIKEKYRKSFKDIETEAVTVVEENQQDKKEGNDNRNNQVQIKLFAQVIYSKEFYDKKMLEKLDNYHIWTEEYIKKRMEYNPKKPMSILLLRVYKIKQPIILNYKDAWIGCKSWIETEFDFNYDDNSKKNTLEPVFKNDDDFNKVINNIKEMINN